MGRARAQKFLFVSVGAAIVFFFQHDRFADWMSDLLYNPNAPHSFGSALASYGYDFFEDRWAFTLAALVALCFAYRMVTAPKGE